MFFAYLKSASVNKLRTHFFLFAVLYVLTVVFRHFFDYTMVDQGLKFLVSSSPVDFFVSGTCAYCLYRIVRKLSCRLLPTLTSLLLGASVIVFYIYMFRSTGNYVFYKFRFADYTYADLLIAAFISLLLDFEPFHPLLKQENAISLIPDEGFAETDRPDLIGNDGYVQKVADVINETAGPYSFGIAVTGPWGSGKTDFMHRIRRTLEKNKTENIVFAFNPWKYKDGESLFTNFFIEFAAALRPYNKGLAADINDYAQSLLGKNDELKTNFTRLLINAVFPVRDSANFENIETSVRKLGKRIIILIDDLDRMNGKEIMQVLKIVRNAGKFPNTFFIVGLDQAYLVEALKKTKKYSREEEYLKKIFQLTITLPLPRKGDLFNALLNYLLDGDPEDNEKIRSAVTVLYSQIPQFLGASKEEFSLERLLDNLRDVKRFANTFKLQFRHLKDDIEVSDLFLLELIKHRSDAVFTGLASRNLLDMTKEQPYTYIVNESKLKKILKNLNVDADTKKALKSAVTRLVSYSTRKTTRQFAFPANFYLYFSNQLFNLISLREFRETIRMNAEKIKTKFDQWSAEGKLNNLQQILDEFESFQTKEDLLKFSEVYLLPSQSDFVSRAQKLLTSDSQHPEVFHSKQDFENLLKTLFQNEALDFYKRAIIANMFLKPYIYERQDNRVFSKQFLQDEIFRFFKAFLNTNPPFDFKVHNFYMLNDDSRDPDRRIIITDKANERMREYLLQEERMNEYLNYLIRSYSLPNYSDEFTVDPFADDIFGGLAYLREVLIGFKPTNKTLERLRKLSIKGIDEMSEKRTFIIKGADREFVLNHLRSTGQYNFDR